jgi:hypothetical protein
MVANNAQVKNDLFKLQSMSPDDAEFSTLLETLMNDLHTHIKHEQNEDMPLLEKVLPEADSEALALQFARVKKLVPTRSHPEAPTSHWVIEGLAGLLHTPIDKIGDLVRTWPDEEGKSTEVDWKNML